MPQQIEDWQVKGFPGSPRSAAGGAVRSARPAAPAEPEPMAAAEPRGAAELPQLVSGTGRGALAAGPLPSASPGLIFPSSPAGGKSALPAAGEF